MIPALLTVVVLSAPPTASAPAKKPEAAVKLAAPGFKCVNVEAQACEFFTDYFAQQLVQHGKVKVTTASEISSLLGFERQKQLLGCSDDSSSCLAEMAGALGVDGLIVGNIARFGEDFAVNVKVLDSRSGQSKASATTRARSESGLLDWFGASAAQFHHALTGKGEPPPPPMASSRPAPMGAVEGTTTVARGPVISPWIPAGAGLAFLVGGGVTFGLAQSRAAFLRDPANGPLSQTELQSQLRQGRTFETTSWVLFGVGAAAATTAGVLWLTAPKSGPTVLAAPAPGGGAISISGVLP